MIHYFFIVHFLTISLHLFIIFHFVLHLSFIFTFTLSDILGSLTSIGILHLMLSSRLSFSLPIFLLPLIFNSTLIFNLICRRSFSLIRLGHLIFPSIFRLDLYIKLCNYQILLYRLKSFLTLKINYGV